VGGTLVDGAGNPPLAHGAVVTANGSIVTIGPADRVTIPADAEVIDASGGTVLPGIVNSHAHVERDVHAVLRAFLSDGVTSVGNTGSAARSVATYRETGRLPDAARGFAAGQAITAPGGYPANRGDGSAARGVRTPAEAEAAVDDMVALGADFIKVCLEPFDFNFRDPGSLPMPSPAAVAAAIRRAHGHDRLVRAHVHHAPQLDIALDAGVDSIEHVLFPLPQRAGYVELLQSGLLQLAALPDFDRRLDRMARQGVYVVPTIGNEVANIARGLPELPADALAAIEALMVEVLAAVHRAGIRVALGNDWVGLPDLPLGLPLPELRYMERAGMTPLEVVEAATRHAAAVCGQRASLGTLELGKLADIVVVEGDPLADVGALANVRHVVKDGRVVPPPAAIAP
jgi:imidazolonepropionase-like amidohydrolase